jgi:uncharacterized membrane protein
VSTKPRRASLDALRGLAVLTMFAWHVVDAGLREELRNGPWWDATRAFGGAAAPLFFAVAGVAVGLAGPQPPAYWAPRALRVARAGLLLAIFQQAVDDGGLLDPRAPGLLVLAAAAVRRSPALLAAGVLLVGVLEPAALLRLLRPDVLYGLAAAIFLTGLVLRSGARAAAAMAGMVAVLTEPLAAALDGNPLAPWIAVSRVGAFSPFPFLAYAALGGAVGARVRAGVGLPTAAVLALGALGLLAYEGGPSAGAIAAAPWLRVPARVLFYGGVFAVAAAASRHLSMVWLRELGRRSLLLYAAHLELTYGLLGLPWRRQLGVVGVTVAFALLVLLAHRAVSSGARVAPIRGPDPSTSEEGGVGSSPNSTG